MAMSLRRKLYTRGSSYETTIPSQLLFALDPAQKHDVLFEFDPKTQRWYIRFETQSPLKKSNTPKSSHAH